MNLRDLEIILKSLVLSSPFDLTLEKLARDFELEAGYSIPFKKLGFVSLESLISSFEGSFILIRKNDTTFVKAKSSSKTSHIEYMISAQTNKQRRKKGFREAWKSSPRVFKGRNVFFNEYKAQSPHYPKKHQTTMCLNANESQKISNSIDKSHFNYMEENDIKNSENANKSKKQVRLGNVTLINECDSIVRIDCTALPDYNESKSDDFVNDLRSTCDVFEELCLENPSEVQSNNQEKGSVSSSNGDSQTSLFDNFCLENQNEIHPNIKENAVSMSSSNDDEFSIFKDDIPVFLDDFPKDVALPEHKIPAANHILDLTVGSQFCLYVSEVHNPHKFWFHMEKSKILDELMFKIELFYQNIGESKEYDMHLSNMNPNQLCVALYNKYWHRAKILQVPVENFVKVYFVDYGTIDNIHISSLKYIHKDFVNIPSQAYRGCFAFLNPADMFWQRDCTYTLLSYVYEKKLWAKLEYFDQDDKIYHITVIDTSTRKDININKFLIVKGYASLCSINKVKTHTQYVYPTFEMIESGHYPSFDELGKLLAKGNDYERDEYKTLKSINTEKLYHCSTLEFWNQIKKF
ncbi:uncharacterized protein LOC129608828 [Condylostylus longicornis]|uniref:uncharacterized protein LOC129608828 n=1 Tax=Condylostylus longicornis TaxID=2530218 RepID=UPI00244DF843|nr:uncharacterized protein LOC129608828 [Condylostylus longicornis]XP_055376543.1 uncharacterized protein LOC129608828 [Condylostylus longicornis]